jgi:hypothetical protein
MRRYAVLDVVLGLVFVGFGVLGAAVATWTLFEPYGCGDAPCNFYETWQSSRAPAWGFGFALLCFGLGGRLIWNVWRGQG